MRARRAASTWPDWKADAAAREKADAEKKPPDAAPARARHNAHLGAVLGASTTGKGLWVKARLRELAPRA